MRKKINSNDSFKLSEFGFLLQLPLKLQMTHKTFDVALTDFSAALKLKTVSDSLKRSKPQKSTCAWRSDVQLSPCEEAKFFIFLIFVFSPSSPQLLHAWLKPVDIFSAGTINYSNNLLLSAVDKQTSHPCFLFMPPHLSRVSGRFRSNLCNRRVDSYISPAERSRNQDATIRWNAVTARGE